MPKIVSTKIIEEMFIGEMLLKKVSFSGSVNTILCSKTTRERYERKRQSNK